MPNLSERLEDGTLNLDTYRCGLPSQTTVAIGGLLYGEMLPGNQWYDKEQGKVVDTFSLDSAISVADGLAERNVGIAEGGQVFLSPLDGEARPEDAYFVFSDSGRIRKASGTLGMTKNALGEFGSLVGQLAAHPIKALQTAVHFGSELIGGLFKRKSSHKSVSTVVKDAFKETILADAASAKIAREIRKGDSSYMFVDLANFDSKSHTYGPGEEAFQSLTRVDRNLDTVLDAIEDSEGEYQVAILADHGSARGYHLHDVHGQSLQAVCENLAPDQEVVTLDFGSGAHVYLPEHDGELNRSALPPPLVEGLRDQKGIAFVVTREGDKSVIESPRGKITIDHDRLVVEGENPLLPFDQETELVAHQIHDLIHRPKTGDVIVFGELHKDGVIDFSTGHFKGGHGGIGLGQGKPFVAWTPDLGLDPSATKDAGGLFRQFTSFLQDER